MLTTNIELYNILITAGVDKDKAEMVAAEIITKTDAKEFLSTKSDLQNLKFELIKWFSMLLAQGALIVTLIELL